MMNDATIIIGLLLYAGVLAILGRVLWDNVALKKKMAQMEEEKEYQIFERGFRMLEAVLHLVEYGAVAFPFVLSPKEMEMFYKIDSKDYYKERK